VRGICLDYLPFNRILEYVSAVSKRKSVLVTSTIACAVAVFTTIAIILPAETSYDPLGIGNLLGLSGLSAPSTQVQTTSRNAHRNHTINFELSPYEFVEWKYQVKEGTVLLYTWSATEDVIFELHGHPNAYLDEGAVAHHTGRTNQQSGTFVSPFDGVHGWYWENRNAAPITITLKAAGYFDLGIEYRESNSIEVDLTDR